MAWTVSLVSFPFVAVPAYLVLGRNKFEGMANALHARQDEIENELEEFKDRLKPFAIPPHAEPSWYSAVQQLSDLDLTNVNKVDLLINGKATFDIILSGVQ